MSDEKNDPLQREVLPIPNEAYAGPVLYDAHDPAAVFPPIQEIRPPKGAPNVLVVLIDDTGFGASSAFGGPINTPTAERLAANGLKVLADGVILRSEAHLVASLGATT